MRKHDGPGSEFLSVHPIVTLDLSFDSHVLVFELFVLCFISRYRANHVVALFSFLFRPGTVSSKRMLSATRVSSSEP